MQKHLMNAEYKSLFSMDQIVLTKQYLLYILTMR